MFQKVTFASYLQFHVFRDWHTPFWKKVALVIAKSSYSKKNSLAFIWTRCTFVRNTCSSSQLHVSEIQYWPLHWCFVVENHCWCLVHNVNCMKMSGLSWSKDNFFVHVSSLQMMLADKHCLHTWNELVECNLLTVASKLVLCQFSFDCCKIVHFHLSCLTYVPVIAYTAEDFSFLVCNWSVVCC